MTGLDTYPRLGEVPDALSLAAGDEAVVQDHVGLDAHNLSSHWLQEEAGAAICEIVAEQPGVFIMLWLRGQSRI